MLGLENRACCTILKGHLARVNARTMVIEDVLQVLDMVLSLVECDSSFVLNCGITLLVLLLGVDLRICALRQGYSTLVRKE